jgi:ketosteroid isomerase-like protein
MPKTTETVLRDIYDAWRAQDLDWLASYLPDDFCHVVKIPIEIHPLGGACNGKHAALERLRLITVEFDFLKFDTSDLMIGRNRAAVEIPIRYRHRETGVPLESIFVNFWTLEEGWPVRPTEYHDIGRIQAFVNDVAAQTPA